MLYPKVLRLLSMLIIVSLLAGALAPTVLLAQTAAEESPPGGIRFDAPPYAIDGPYAVGVRYFTIPAERETDQELTASVWYPALNPDGETGEMVYEQQFQPGNIPPFSVLGHALLDAEPDASGGPYPLIVYSHAHWSMAQELPYFAEHLASRGFVVIAVDHEDNWSTAFGPMSYEAVIRRPQEVTRQIDFAEMLSADDGHLPGLIATEKVGVAGWSMGALTSMEVAGARKDLATLRAWCAADPLHVEALDFGCVDILENEAEMAGFAGLDEIPAGLWPSTKDERIVAAVPMSGPTATLGSEGLAYVDIPILFFHGGGEAEIDPSLLMGNPYESVSSPRKAEVVLDQGEHLLFFSSCADSPSIVEIGFPMFCTDPVWDTDRAHDLINHFTTAFFQAELKGDEEAAAALATNQVSFPGIEYREMGYGAAPEAMSTSESKGLRPDAPVYGVRGPNAVGAKDFTIEIGVDLITGTIWYPAKNSTNKLQEMTYTISEANGYFPGLPVVGRAIGDAIPAIEDGPYPLVIFMTGGAAWRQMSSYLVEHLASQGFVVISADPRGEFPGDLWQGAAARILDTKTLINYAETMHIADNGWTGMIDMEHVAVVGWSSGGWAALMASGARFDFGWCAANPEFVAEHEDTDCNHFVPHLAEISEMVGLESVPDGMWPPINDPRVDAVVALAPDGDIWGAEFEGVAAMDTPLLLMAGSSDSVNIPEVTTYPIYENAGSAKKGLLTLNGAGHMVFGNQCQATPWMAEEFFWGCSDSVWDMDRAHDLINHFATAFLLAELKGDAEAVAALAPENVSFPGIEYQSAGYDQVASLPAETVAEIESIVEKAMTVSTVPGMGVAVVQDGEIVYAQGFGVTDIDTGEPVTADTPFLWAESTFAPTTFAVMQLVEQGKIDLDALITDYLPYFQLADERYTDITVRHILQQRSGLADSGDRMADWTTFQPQNDPGALERHVRGLADKPLLFAPGTQQEWSDVAYTLLGDVIAKVSGQDFETYMQEHILSPLGMTHSSFLLDELDAGLMAQPHLKQAGKAVLSGHYPYHRPFGAANNLMASIRDMARLAQVSLHRGEVDGVSILSDDSFTQMWGASEPTPFGDFPFGVTYPTKVMLEWGLGWFVSDDAGTPLYSTFGREYGFQGQLSVAPEAGLAVMAIGNTEITGAYYASDVAVDVLRMLLAQRSEQAAQPSPEVSDLDPTVTTEIEAILNQQMTDNQVPGMALCIVKDGQVAYNKGFGVAEVGTETPITPQSVFFMASVSKSLTAVAIMQLVEQGKIELEALATDYLPDFTMADNRYKRITIHHLLNHTSGLADEFGHELSQTGDPVKQAVADLSDQFLQFNPGNGWLYSGVGYTVLGKIIATVSGMDYETYMQTNILEPLGMTHATFVPEKADPALFTARHVTDANGSVVVSEEMPCDPRRQAECTLHASCSDMIRFAKFSLNRGELDGQRVLGQEQFDKMISTTIGPAPNAATDIFSLATAKYALGWQVGTVGDHLVFGHPGGIQGANTHLLIAPDDDLALIVLSNWATEPDGWPASFAAIEAMYPLLGVAP